MWHAQPRCSFIHKAPCPTKPYCRRIFKLTKISPNMLTRRLNAHHTTTCLTCPINRDNFFKRPNQATPNVIKFTKRPSQGQVCRTKELLLKVPSRVVTPTRSFKSTPLISNVVRLRILKKKSKPFLKRLLHG